MNETRQPMGHPTQPHPVHPHPAQPNHHQPHPVQPNHHPQPHRPAFTPAAPGARPTVVPPPMMKPPSDDELSPISLVEESPPQLATATLGAPPAPKKIIAFGADAHKQQHNWKRSTVKTGTGACRVRSFHGKYSEQGLEYLDNAINEWLDSHADVEVKFVTSTVMTFEGKVREPALVLNVWY